MARQMYSLKSRAAVWAVVSVGRPQRPARSTPTDLLPRASAIFDLVPGLKLQLLLDAGRHPVIRASAGCCFAEARLASGLRVEGARWILALTGNGIRGSRSYAAGAPT